jgi:hypothetical protein
MRQSPQLTVADVWSLVNTWHMVYDHPTIAGTPINLVGNYTSPINFVMTSPQHIYTLQLLTMARMTRMTIQCLK